MLWLKRRALTIRGCGVLNRVETLIGLAKGLGIPAGTIVGAMENALENPDTWLEEHEKKMSRTET